MRVYALIQTLHLAHYQSDLILNLLISLVFLLIVSGNSSMTIWGGERKRANNLRIN